MLREVAILFLKLGTLGFGGPAAHIALMRQEVVERRQWLSETEFLDLLGAANLIPGPSSTELAIHIGFRQCGWLGLLAAGICFILPAACMVTVIAWAYVRFHALPEVANLMYGIKPVVVAIVFQAVWNLCRTSLRSRILPFVALSAAVMSALGVQQIVILVMSGVAIMAIRVPRSLLVLTPGALLTGGLATAEPVTLSKLFWVFAKIGAIVFGSGYVLLAFLQTDLVNHLHWLKASQLLDAVAVGQITPGPVFTTATFIGYLVAGLPGAAVATLAIFLPGWILVAASGPFIPRLRGSTLASAFLDGVTAASIGLIAWVLVLIAKAAFSDVLASVLALVSTGLLFRYRVNTAWLVLAGGLVGLLRLTRPAVVQ
jgi:chromate transporter